MHKSFLSIVFTLAALCFPGFVHAQAPWQKNIQIAGKTLDGQAFDLAKQKGKVVLVMFWATDCAVCRDKMRELRENAKGWQGQPFTLVLISADRRMSDVDSYNAIINKSVPLKERLTQLWSFDPSYQDNLGTTEVMKNRTATTLPLTFVIDKKGEVVKRYQGRIPADVWDDIAELL
ncbi:TlpA disulfide reductase family protein [Variovorax sp. PCZ-1]|uniref:TlpA disulfide reductase family protein n=1 Tax=Variovorax sp. PCZ-1 TaxID=2835533 RepID=UPI001BCD00AF|nr:TlpA disulfide reductase family protein [Variovorax sp. PCZ-1]MBS7806077.1 TlpA family protein disulfide reductase [Variovorax sp. PCZ-1]